MMRSNLLLQWSAAALFFLGFVLPGHAQQYSVSSPDGSLEMKVSVGATLQYEVIYNDIPVLAPSAISLTLDNGSTPGVNGSVLQTETRSVNETITRTYGKSPELSDQFNELTITFTEQYSLVLRAYNEGVAYRFQTTLDGDVIVVSEEANFNFVSDASAVFPEADPAMWSWERSYNMYPSITGIGAGKFCITPALFSYEAQGLRIVLAESDLFDYPGMYLERNTQNGMKGKWAHYPKTVSDPGNVYAYHRVLTRENYIAKTKGTRLYPWRVVMVSSQDTALLTNELIYKLATPPVITNTSWIKPGKSAWEWWHDAILETPNIPSGTANLGFNLYKYYIDFAAENKLEYVTLDAGWNMSYAAQVCQYAASRNVKVFLWDFVNLPVVNPERLTQLKTIGAAGVKIDLIERDDQVAVNWLEQLAKDCAARELMVVFHGCSKPTGLQRTYPNIVNIEAVRGAECAKWDDTPNPDYHLQFPFIRMLAGPLDYTPGSMRNLHRSQFSPIPTGIPNTMGSRIHEVAMYVIFDHPLAYLCDSPTEYRKYRDILRFLSHVPTTWDRTLPLSAKLGEYAVMARQQGEEWYVGAMTNHEGRQVEIDFSFLPDGVERFAEVLRDNDLTDTNAKAYTYEVLTVTKQSKHTFRLSPEGGLAMRVHGLVTGSEDDMKHKKFQVYLNPDRTQLTVESREKLSALYIIDASGRVHYHEAGQGDLSRRIDISQLPSGVYIVYGAIGSRFHHGKFLK